MEHRAAELESQVFDVPATAARPGRRRRRDMDRQQALSRLVPVGSAGSAGLRGPAPAESDSRQRVALGTDAVIDAPQQTEACALGEDLAQCACLTAAIEQRCGSCEGRRATFASDYRGWRNCCSSTPTLWK